MTDEEITKRLADIIGLTQVPTAWQIWFKPLQNYDHIFMCVEKARARGYYIEIGLDHDKTECYCVLVGGEEVELIERLSNHCFIASNKSSNYAIAEALLKAYGVWEK